MIIGAARSRSGNLGRAANRIFCGDEITETAVIGRKAGFCAIDVRANIRIADGCYGHRLAGTVVLK